ncbi:alpha/beta hydrolase [Rubrivirga sp. S365]|uniref:Alpha/beta hydrolase n=1 Tax=Rubrivirga litoralis TaxID=3075598 RepID=A0ABU3BRV5_9BACT|nr:MULTISPECIES: alpha/beta hydrolase [unclassified Rubrivirga]MDT0632003.1 alpha/beta hydrolase [Rubrivirga sp. F394]MDT7855304.1 alpha/beta hydrolase [Rubrivirga sp. S365]
MPTLSLNGAEAFYADSGGDGEPVVLGHGYLMTSALWDRQAEALAEAGYRAVRLDWRGQGRSEVTAGGYDPWGLAADALALADRLGLERFHWVGHSMGGYVGYRLALRAPRRVASLVQIGTAAGAEGGAARRQYDALLWALRALGYGAVLGRVLPILYGPTYLADPARAADRTEQERRIRSNSRAGVFRAGRGIFGRDDVAGQLGRITAPTLVVTGEHDRPHPPHQGRADAERIPDATFVELADVGHTPPAEAPAETTRLVLDWLRRHPIA